MCYAVYLLNNGCFCRRRRLWHRVFFRNNLSNGGCFICVSVTKTTAGDGIFKKVYAALLPIGSIDAYIMEELV